MWLCQQACSCQGRIIEYVHTEPVLSLFANILSGHRRSSFDVYPCCRWIRLFLPFQSFLLLCQWIWVLLFLQKFLQVVGQAAFSTTISHSHVYLGRIHGYLRWNCSNYSFGAILSYRPWTLSAHDDSPLLQPG